MIGDMERDGLNGCRMAARSEMRSLELPAMQCSLGKVEKEGVKWVGGC